MDITQDRTFTWSTVTRRVDNSPVLGTVTYLLEIVDAEGSTTTFSNVTSPFVVNLQQEGLTPGEYTAYVRAQEEYHGVGRVSDRSNGFPLVLELIALPMAPTNLRAE